MRFKFVGGADAPEWFLQETVFLSQLSAVRFKLVSLAVYRHLLGAPLDHERLRRYLAVKNNAAHSSESDLKALVAAVALILTGAARFDVSLQELQKELIQVGGKE